MSWLAMAWVPSTTGIGEMEDLTPYLSYLGHATWSRKGCLNALSSKAAGPPIGLLIAADRRRAGLRLARPVTGRSNG